MKPQTCCCHVCRTSLNQYKREFIPCTTCNKIICKPCFGTRWKGETWEEVDRCRKNYSCPPCKGTCTCPRCKKRPRSYMDQNQLDSEDLIRNRLSNPSTIDELRVRERRCDMWIKEMEKMIIIMKREKEELVMERQRLETLLIYQEVEII